MPAIFDNCEKVERIPTIDSQDFYLSYIKPQQPVVLTDVATHWAAMERWSFDFFIQIGQQDFSIEEVNALQNETCFSTQTLSAYVQSLMAMNEADESLDEAAPAQPRGYMSQCDLFAAFPELRDDVDFSIMTNHKLKSKMLGWIGPKGTLTGFHFDYADGLLAQIRGQKSLYLVSPDQSAFMYPSKKFDDGSVASQIEAGHHDPEKFPLFSHVRMLTTILSPGEMIFIPRGWWHQVESLSPSISVNTFGISVKNYIVDRIPNKIRAILHTYGLYGKDCTCHMWQDGKRLSANFFQP